MKGFGARSAQPAETRVPVTDTDVHVELLRLIAHAVRVGGEEGADFLERTAEMMRQLGEMPS